MYVLYLHDLNDLFLCVPLLLWIQRCCDNPRWFLHGNQRMDNVLLSDGYLDLNMCFILVHDPYVKSLNVYNVYHFIVVLFWASFFAQL